MAVITISRQMGSLGIEIAQKVADQLKYEYWDKESIEQGLAAHGVAVPEVEKYDEKSLPFWNNWQNQGRKFFHVMQMVIYEAARRDKVVVVGRGGQILLKKIPGVLHVRIIAPLQDRVQRLVAQDGGNEKESLRILKQSDRDSGGFIRTFLDADWGNADLYDLTINTHCLPVDVGVDMILCAIPAVEAMKDSQRFQERLDDLILQQKVETALLNANIRSIRVEVAGGVVTLRGSVSSNSEVRNCLSLISGVEGVHKVESNIVIYNIIGT